MQSHISLYKSNSGLVPLPAKGQKGSPHRQTLWEVEAVMPMGWRGCSAVGLAVGGAEESGLVKAQLLQFLWVLCECGGEQQLLQRRLRWRQTTRTRRSADHRPGTQVLAAELEFLSTPTLLIYKLLHHSFQLFSHFDILYQHK